MRRAISTAAAVLIVSAAFASEPMQIRPFPADNTACDFPGRPGADTQVTSLGSSFGSSLAWTEYGYGVAWTDHRDGHPEIYFATLDQNGNKLGDDVRVTDAPSWADAPSLVWTGTEFAVAWLAASGNDRQIYFARLDPSGNTIGGHVLIAAGLAIRNLGPALAWTGSGYGVVWGGQPYNCGNDRDRLWFARLDSTGLKIGEDVPLCVEPFSAYGGALVWTGTQYAVTWQGETPGGNSDVFFARLDAEGNAIGTIQRISDPSIESRGPSTLAWTGSRFGLAWCDAVQSTARLAVAILDAEGNRLSQSHPSLTCGAPSLATTGSEFAVAWTDSTQALSGLYFARVDADGNKVGSAVPLISALSVSSPSLVWTGLGYALAWDAVSQQPPYSIDVFVTRLQCDCRDLDNDGFSSCATDCNDTDPTVYPDAVQICDGINNDCNDATWPTVPANEAEEDGDGYRVCDGDCNDANAAAHPGAQETCNGADDNCDGSVDEDGAGVDSDADGIRNICDNCRFVTNPSQLDTDADGLGNSCDNCLFVMNPDQTDADTDARGDACDNCPLDVNPFQDDLDHDAKGDACDNCPFDFNPDQRDFDADFEGDRCDLNDGLLLVLFNERDYLEWQEEAGFSAWNSYKGDLAVLKAAGVYTQVPASNALARRDCGLAVPWAEDFTAPAVGQVAFFLVTGVSGVIEGSLGQDSTGAERPNENPCP